MKLVLVECEPDSPQLETLRVVNSRREQGSVEEALGLCMTAERRLVIVFECEKHEARALWKFMTLGLACENVRACAVEVQTLSSVLIAYSIFGSIDMFYGVEEWENTKNREG